MLLSRTAPPHPPLLLELIRNHQETTTDWAPLGGGRVGLLGWREVGASSGPNNWANTVFGIYFIFLFLIAF